MACVVGPVCPVGGYGQGSHQLGCGWEKELVVLTFCVPKDVGGRKIVAQDLRGVWRGCLLGDGQPAVMEGA